MENQVFENILNQVSESPKRSEITILKSRFKIIGEESTYHIEGELIFTWSGSARTKIKGEIIGYENNKGDRPPIFAGDHILKVYINEIEIAECFRSLYSEKGEIGVFAEFTCITGAELIDVDRENFNCVKFLIPNLYIEQSFKNQELTFRSLKIKIHRISDPSRTNKETIKEKSNGISYWVEIKHKTNRNINPSQFQDFEKCFYFFLKMTFGKRISPILYTYFLGSEEIKLETKSRNIEGNKTLKLWSSSSKIELGVIWERFSDNWIKNPYYFKEYIPTLSEWYLEALSGNFDSKTIVAGQICLELLFSTVCIEILKLPDNPREFQSASFKFKLLLNSIGLRHPYFKQEDFPHLKNVIQKVQQASDPIDLITQLRNRVIHYKPFKNSKILKEGQTTIECAALLLWYIEISFLAVIGYKGFYHSRNQKFPNWKDEEFSYKI